MTGFESSILFDTNILIFAHNLDSPFYEEANNLQESVNQGFLKGALAVQNLLEFYSTITNQNAIRNSLAPEYALKEINKYLISPFEIIFPTGNEIRVVNHLLADKQILGRKIFDVYIVATMLANGIRTIYTHNEKDFKIFKEVEVINPFN